jgi:hypothetical protein
MMRPLPLNSTGLWLVIKRKTRPGCPDVRIWRSPQEARDASVMSGSHEEFMAKWGIQSKRELGDIVTILEIVARSDFQRHRPKWSQQFGEKTLKAVESMPTYYPSTSATPAAPMLTGCKD